MHRLRSWLSRQFYRVAALIEPADDFTIGVSFKDGQRLAWIQFGSYRFAIPVSDDEAAILAHGLTAEEWEIEATQGKE